METKKDEFLTIYYEGCGNGKREMENGKWKIVNYVDERRRHYNKGQAGNPVTYLPMYLLTIYLLVVDYSHVASYITTIVYNGRKSNPDMG